MESVASGRKQSRWRRPYCCRARPVSDIGGHAPLSATDTRGDAKAGRAARDARDPVFATSETRRACRPVHRRDRRARSSAFARMRARASRRRGIDSWFRFHATEGLSAAVGKDTHLATTRATGQSLRPGGLPRHAGPVSCMRSAREASERSIVNSLLDSRNKSSLASAVRRRRRCCSWRRLSPKGRAGRCRGCWYQRRW